MIMNMSMLVIATIMSQIVVDMAAMIMVMIMKKGMILLLL